MSKARRRLALIGVCSGLAALGGPAISTALAAKRVFVSNVTPVTANGGDCEHPGFATIQEAVNAVTPNTSIEVCPGTYAEQLVIEKGVRINAPEGLGSATVTWPASIGAATDPCVIRRGEGTEIVLCTSEAVSLTNLTVDARVSTATCSNDLYGIVVGGGARLAATHDAVLGAGPDSCSGGVGLQVGSGPGEQVGHAKLVESSINSYDLSGLVAEGAGSSVAVLDSSIGTEIQHHAPTGVAITNGASGSVKRSTIFGNANVNRARGIGIDLERAAPTVLVSHDQLEGNGVGLHFVSGAATQPGSPEVRIVHNRFVDSETVGLLLDQGDALVNSNEIEGGTVGIRIAQYAEQTFAPNSSASRDTISGMSEAAIEVQSDGSSQDHAGDFLIQHSSISGNAAEVRDQSTTFTVTRRHDT